MTTLRNLLLIFFTLFCWAITTNGNCEDIPANCVWNSQQRTYTCDIIGVPNDIVIRRLPLSHLSISGNISSVTASPEMKDIGISWNKTYATLFFQKGSRPRETYLLLISSIKPWHIICGLFKCITIFFPIQTRVQVTIRSLDVQLINQTEITHPEDHEVILQCSIIGLNTDETDYDIKFYNLPKCEHYQQQLVEINDGYSIISSSNGTTRTSELHINVSQSGSYSCKVKLHKDEPEECVFIETPPMIIDIEATCTSISTNAPTTNKHKPAIITGSVLSIIILALITIIIIMIVKTCKQREQVQPQQPQPGPPPPVDGPEPQPEYEAQVPPPNAIAPDHFDDEHRQLLGLEQQHGYGAIGGPQGQYQEAAGSQSSREATPDPASQGSSSNSSRRSSGGYDSPTGYNISTL